MVIKFHFVYFFTKHILRVYTRSCFDEEIKQNTLIRFLLFGHILTLFLLGDFLSAVFFVCFFQNQLFRKIPTGISSEC